MWRETVADSALAPAHLVLLEESCRIADRLDALDAAIRGSSVEDDDIRGLLAEARQQSAVLKGLLAEIRQGSRATESDAKRGGDGVADLTARIAARRSNPSR